MMHVYGDINNVLTIFMDSLIQNKEINGCQNQAKVVVISVFFLLLCYFIPYCIYHIVIYIEVYNFLLLGNYVT